MLFDLLAHEEPDRWVTRPHISRLIATPLIADGVLYLSTPLYRAAAIDARTGQTLWVYGPRTYESGTPAEVPWSHRGVAYWEKDGEARVVWATGDGYLIVVDAKTGLPAAYFGEHERVDLTVGLPRAPRGQRDIQNLLQLSSHSPQNPHVFPEGVGRWMYPGQRLTVNAHYYPSGTEETDETRIGLYWGKGELKKELSAGFSLEPQRSRFRRTLPTTSSGRRA